MSLPPEFYLPLRHAHIGLVALSLSLFAVRGLGVMARSAWPMHPAVRTASVGIDSLLLAAGVALWLLLGLNPLRTAPWLGIKLLALVAYIVLGSLALKRARSPGGRLLAYLGALACVGWMISIARMHDPAGVFRVWLGG